jgi:hypothetical protein
MGNKPKLKKKKDKKNESQPSENYGDSGNKIRNKLTVVVWFLAMFVILSLSIASLFTPSS